MNNEITTNIKLELKVIPLYQGVIVEKVTEDKENLIIELKFATEFVDTLNSNCLLYNVNGKCIVSINKYLFVKNNYQPMDKNFISFQINENLPILTKSVFMDRITYFTYKIL